MNRSSRSLRFKALMGVIAAGLAWASPAPAENERFTCVFCVGGPGGDCGIAPSVCTIYCGEGSPVAYCAPATPPACDAGYNLVVCGDPE